MKTIVPKNLAPITTILLFMTMPKKENWIQDLAENVRRRSIGKNKYKSICFLLELYTLLFSGETKMLPDSPVFSFYTLL